MDHEHYFSILDYALFEVKTSPLIRQQAYLTNLTKAANLKSNPAHCSQICRQFNFVHAETFQLCGGACLINSNVKYCASPLSDAFYRAR